MDFSNFKLLIFSVLSYLYTSKVFLSPSGRRPMEEDAVPLREETEGLAWRVSLSILGGVGWLVFLIVWLFFYAQSYAWERNVAVFLLSLLLLVVILGVPWALWAYKKQTAAEKEMLNIKGFRWRIFVSILFMLGAFVFLIYWYWVVAEPYDIYQNLAIFIVTLLITGGLLAAMWAPWGMKYDSAQRNKSDEPKKQ